MGECGLDGWSEAIALNSGTLRQFGPGPLPGLPGAARVVGYSSLTYRCDGTAMGPWSPAAA
jgi:hypothetical protein